MKDSPAARLNATAALARLLDVPIDRVSYLLAIPAPDIAAVHRQIDDQLFATTEAGLGKIVAATRVLPPHIAAKVATRNDSPLMTAHLAAVMDTPRAVGVARRLDADYLARVARHLDASRARPLINGLPAGLVAAVTRAIADRQDWLTLSTMITVATDDQLARCLDTLDAGEVVAAVALLTDQADTERVVALVSQPLGEQLREPHVAPDRSEG